MKTKDWFIIVGGVLFAYLFYKQAAGLNYLVYTLFVVAGLLLSNPKNITNKRWWLSIAALAVSLCGMVLYGSTVAWVAVLFSLLLIAGYSSNARASAVLNFIQSSLAVPLSVPNFFRQNHIAAENKRRATGKKTSSNGFVYIIIICIFILFVLLYSASSTAFSELLKQINFSFISFGWVMCALLGIFVSYALLKGRRFKFLDREETKWGLPLLAPLHPLEGEQAEKNTVENKAGTLLLVLLNILLLVVNSSDIAFLAGGISANQNLNYSEMVHQGIGALIFSILIAVGIILYFFRGKLNFDEKAKTLQVLALVWMLQNLLLTATGAYKNLLYIDIEDGLTYKRVGVFFYLLLASIGLLFTAVKVYTKKPNWYLVRVNFTAFFIVLIASSPVDWDVVITSYNIKQAAQKNEDPDIEYLLRLSNRNLPLIEEWMNKAAADPKTLRQYKAWEYNSLAEKFTNKSVLFNEKYAQKGWQSWNLTDHNNYEYLKGLNYNKYFISLAGTETIDTLTTPINNGYGN